MPEKVSLFRYWGCVTTLRGKGYSWRDISGMLEKDGIKISFTQLYRHEKRLEAGLVREDEEDGT